MNRFKRKRACITRENSAHWIDMKSSSHLYLYSAFNNTDCVKALNSIKLEDRVSVMYNNNTNLEKFFIQIRVTVSQVLYYISGVSAFCKHCSVASLAYWLACVLRLSMFICLICKIFPDSTPAVFLINQSRSRGRCTRHLSIHFTFANQSEWDECECACACACGGCQRTFGEKWKWKRG